MTETRHDITLGDDALILVNGRVYAIPPGCRFIAFRLADGAPVDGETMQPLPESPDSICKETASSVAGKPEGP